MENNPWKILNESVVYDNKWIRVHHYEMLNPAGGKGIYGKVHFKNIAVGVVPIDDDGNTFLIGQYRFPLKKYSWEIPEGGCALDEQPIDAAKRELLEETGLVATEWQQILTMDLSNSVSDEVCVVFVAKKLQQHHPEPEETEQLQIKKCSLSQVFAMVERAEITDAISVAALQKIQLMSLKNKCLIF